MILGMTLFQIRERGWRSLRQKADQPITLPACQHFLKLNLNSPKLLCEKVRSHKTQIASFFSSLSQTSTPYISSLPLQQSCDFPTDSISWLLRRQELSYKYQLRPLPSPQYQLSTTSILLIFIFNLRLRCASPFCNVWIPWELRGRQWFGFTLCSASTISTRQQAYQFGAKLRLLQQQQ
jgi:hypothetical protein